MPDLIDSLRTGNPAAAFASVYDSMEVRTALTPPIVTGTQGLFPTTEGGQPNVLLNFLRPTVILRGRGGEVVVAPNGQAGNGTFLFLGVIGALVGVGFVLGRWSK